MTSFPSSWPACGPAAHPATLLPVLDGGVDRKVWDFRLGSLPSDVTYTGANQKYYTNSDGTLTSFASGEARIGDRGLLIEEARTNLLTYSRDLSNAAHNKARVTVAASAVETPYGTTTAYKVVPNTDNNTHVLQRLGATASAETEYTHSGLCRADGYGFLTVSSFDGTARYVDAVFDFSTGAVSSTTAGTASIEALANGWYRWTLTGTTSAGASSQSIEYYIGSDSDNKDSFAGDGSSGLILTDIQMEAAGSASSVIFTEGSTVTRAADVATPTILDGSYDILIEREGGKAWTLAQAIASNNYNLPVDMSDPYILRVMMFSAGQLSAAQRAALAA